MEVRFGRNFADNEPGLLKPGCLSEPKPPLPPECAGLKDVQEKINKNIAKQEFINMILTKTNVFRNELFNLKVKSKEIQAKIQHDIDFINSNIEFKSIDDLRQKKACSIDNLLCDLNNVKQELAGAKAYLAEVRKHSKDSPALKTKTEPQNLELTSQKLQTLNDALFYNIVRMKWASAELKSYFEHEKLLRDKMKFALAKLNVNSKPPLQPPTPENKHSSSAPERTYSHFEMLTKLNDMANRLSKLSCGPSEVPAVPISTPAPITDIPLPTPTFEPKPANFKSVDTQPLFPKAEPVWPRFEMLFKNNIFNHVSTGSSTSEVPTSAPAPAFNTTPMFKPEATKGKPTRRIARRRRCLGTTVVQFKPLVETETIGNKEITVNHQCITLMDEYANKSLEELRFEDYIRMGKLKKKQAESKAFFAALGGLGTTVAFKPVVGTDVIVKYGLSDEEIKVNHHCITMMEEYKHLSLEEIRLQDFIIKGRFTKLQQKSNAFVGEISGVGTTPYQFKPLSESDVYAGAKITVNLQCITCMEEYKDKSIDELRLEDYCIASRVRKLYSAVPKFPQQQKIEEFFSAKKAMPIFSSPTLENWNKFGQGPKMPTQTRAPETPTMWPKTPIQASETPTRPRETPTMWPKTPTKASETPTRARESSTRWRKTPTRASETPTQAHGTPTRASETPTQAHGTPTRASEKPKQAHGTPTRTSETPTQAHGTPTRASEKPKQAHGTPTRTSETPTQARDAPTKSRETPTRASETPTQAHGTPTRASETPTQAHGTPTRASETPTQAHGTPTRTSETPTQAHGTPTRTSETPTQARDAPTKSRETPTRASETPTQVHGTPTRASETPTQAHGTPTRTSETPTQAHGTPTRASEKPKQAHGTPTRTSETPTQARDAPTKSRETPTRASETPTQVQGTPTRASETPTQARDAPTRTSETPKQAHGTPTRASETSTQARDAPTKSHETPTQAREKPTQASETPIQRLAERKKEAGERFYDFKNYEEAVKMFSEACKLCPESPVYLTDRAGALMKLGRHREALEDAKKAVAIDQAFTAGYMHIARCCLFLGEVASGEVAARRVNELAPSCAHIVHDSLQTLRKMRENARQLMDKDNYYDALSALNFCLKHYSPSCSKTKLMKAECLASMRKYQDARDIAIPLSRLNGFDAEAIYIVGLCSFHQDNDEQAIKYFQNVLQFDPDHERAIKMYKLTKTRKNNKAIIEKRLMGNEAFKRNDLQRALHLYNEGLTIDKNNKEENAKLYYNKSTVYVKLNQIYNAIQACTAALDIDENYLKALSRRAHCYAQLKKYQESLDDYENLYFIEPNDQNKRALDEADKVLRAHIGANYYYKILEISKNASKDDIKKAYRDKARLYHPDKHACASVPVIRKNERKFKQTKEAYDVLSDPIRRANYDRYQKNDDQWEYCSESD